MQQGAELPTTSPTPKSPTRDSKETCDTELAVQVLREVWAGKGTQVGICDVNAMTFCLMEKLQLWRRCKAGYPGWTYWLLLEKQKQLVVRRKRNIRKKPTEVRMAPARPGQWRKPNRKQSSQRRRARNSLGGQSSKETDYVKNVPSVTRLLFGLILYLYTYSRKKSLQEGKTCSSCKIDWD